MKLWPKRHVGTISKNLAYMQTKPTVVTPCQATPCKLFVYIYIYSYAQRLPKSACDSTTHFYTTHFALLIDINRSNIQGFVRDWTRGVDQDGRVWLGHWFDSGDVGGGRGDFLFPIGDGSIASAFCFCTPYLPHRVGRGFHIPSSSL